MQAHKETSALILADHWEPFSEEQLREAIISLYNKGYRTFYAPLHSDFELVAAEIIISLNVFRHDNPFPNLNLIVPIYSFAQTLRHNTSEELARRIKILDSARQVIHVRNNSILAFSAVEYAFYRSSLLLTNVNPTEMQITCEGDEELQIEDFPLFVAYNNIDNVVNLHK